MDDLINRQAAIDALRDAENHAFNSFYKGLIKAHKIIADLPSAQPDITDEQAIGHLQASGWMQSHDKQMYEMGLKERIADDSDSYDALLPSVQPEIIRCKDCKHWKFDHTCREHSLVSPMMANEFCSRAERKQR